jgi:hypothetical protein
MKTNKSIPINKRWPGQFAIRAVVYTPTGGRLEVEGPHSETEVKAILAILLPEQSDGIPVHVEPERAAKIVIPHIRRLRGTRVGLNHECDVCGAWSHQKCQ